MSTKLTLLIDRGFTVETVSWLPKTHTYAGHNKFVKLEKEKHYALRGTHIYVSEGLFRELNREMADPGQVVSAETVLHRAHRGSKNKTPGPQDIP